jgi:hypothetical protein
MDFLLVLLVVGALGAMATWIKYGSRSAEYALRKGRFTPAPGRAGAFAFSGDFGLVELDAAGAQVLVSWIGQTLAVPLADIEAVRLRVYDEPLEFDPSDKSAQYECIAWYTVHLDRVSAERVPVFIVGQRQRKDLTTDDILVAERARRLPGARTFATKVHGRIRKELLFPD